MLIGIGMRGNPYKNKVLRLELARELWATGQTASNATVVYYDYGLRGRYK